MTTITPVLLSTSQSGTPDHMSIELVFATAMARGAGAIYITDGAMQTVIDPDTGLPGLRVVGATDTRLVAASDLHISGEHVFIDGTGLKPGHTYSILMEPGALASTTQRAFAGITAPGTAGFTTPASATASLVAFEVSDTILNAGDSASVTIRFSEAVTGLTAAAFSTPGAVLSNLSSNDGMTWFATLAAEGGNIESSGSISVDLGSVRDGAGHPVLMGAAMPAYTVDTRAPQVASIALGGPSIGGSQAIDLTLAFSEKVATLSESAIDTPHASISGLHTIDDGRTWVGTLSTTDTSPSSGNAVRVDMSKVFDLAGNAGGGISLSEATYSVVIAPPSGLSISAPADGGTIDAGADLVIQFNEAAFLGADSDYDLVKLTSASTGISEWVYIDERSFSGDHKTLTIRADDLHLDGGSDYTVMLPGDLQDGHDVAIGDNTVTVHTTGSYTDSSAPYALHAEARSSGGSYGPGDVIEIRVRFSEPVNVVSGQTPSIELNTGGFASYAGSSDDHRELRFTYTVSVGDDEVSRLDVSDPSGLAGKLEDEAGNDLDVYHLLFSKLVNSSGDIAIDMGAPAAPTGIALAVGSDSGTSGDWVTAVARPTIGGSAERGANVELFEGDTRLGSAVADDHGAWSIALGADLSEGLHNLWLQQTDVEGRVSPSTMQELTIDKTAPATLAAPVLTADSDTGSSHADRITSDKTPTFEGSGAEANTLIELYIGTTMVGRTTSDATGHYEVALTETGPLGDGGWAFTVRQVDAAGNAGAKSAVTSVTVDTLAPTVGGFTGSIPVGGEFKLWFSETVEHGSVGDASLFDALGLLLSSLVGGDSGNWEETTHDGHPSTQFHLRPALSGHLTIDLGTVQDVAGNVAVIGTSSYAFTIGIIL